MRSFGLSLTIAFRSVGSISPPSNAVVVQPHGLILRDSAFAPGHAQPGFQHTQSHGLAQPRAVALSAQLSAAARAAPRFRSSHKRPAA